MPENTNLETKPGRRAVRLERRPNWLKERERTNEHLRKAVSKLTLHTQILKEAVGEKTVPSCRYRKAGPWQDRAPAAFFSRRGYK